MTHYCVLETTIRLHNGKGCVRERNVALCMAKEGTLVTNARKVSCPKCKELLCERARLEKNA